MAVRLWQDRFEPGGKIYRGWSDDKPGEWKSRPGFVELIENLIHARDQLDGVVLLIAKDKRAAPRSIERSTPAPNLKMRIIELDEDAGAYVLERLDG